MQDLLKEFSIEHCSINVKFPEDKIGGGIYLLSIVEIINSVWQIGAGVLLSC